MEERIQKLEKEMALIKERNWRVEADKSWERSSFRVLLIVVITYSITASVMYYIGANNFWQNALVPATGYFLSVQAIPVIKHWWIKTFLK